MAALILTEFTKRIGRIIVSLFAYFLISTVTAMMIRVAVRCAMILIYPCIWLEEVM